MDTDKVTAVLVKPAAGRINQAALILCTDKGSETDGVKLSPALVEKTPDGDGGKERLIINLLRSWTLLYLILDLYFTFHWQEMQFRCIVSYI